METINKTSVSQLNELVEIQNDRVQGYERATAETTDKELQDLFKRMASNSRGYRSELSSEIRRMEGVPTENVTDSGKVFRAWMDVKAALAGKSKKVILNTFESEEDATLRAYEDFLNTNSSLPENIHEVILKQKQALKREHDFIKNLRDETRAL